MILEFIARLCNLLFKRQCKTCAYWRSHHYGAAGNCHRSPFVALSTEYSFHPACKYYQKRDGAQ